MPENKTPTRTPSPETEYATYTTSVVPAPSLPLTEITQDSILLINFSELPEYGSLEHQTLAILLSSNKDFYRSHHLGDIYPVYLPEENKTYHVKFSMSFALKHCNHDALSRPSEVIKKFRVFSQEHLAAGCHGEFTPAPFTLVFEQKSDGSHFSLKERASPKAIKTMVHRPEKMALETFLTYAEHERQIANQAGLRINPLTIHNNNTVFLHMPFIQGHTLQHLIEGKKLTSLTEKIICAAMMSLAIHHLHIKKIIHGDIKPDNLILRTALTVENLFTHDAVTIIDYGSAKLANEEWISFLYFLFIAPEQHRKDTTSTFQSDYWMLGICLSSLLTGHPLQLKYTPEEIQKFRENYSDNIKNFRDACKNTHIACSENDLKSAIQLEKLVKNILDDNPEKRLNPQTVFVALISLLVKRKDLALEQIPSEWKEEIENEMAKSFHKSSLRSCGHFSENPPPKRRDGDISAEMATPSLPSKPFR